ncbi:MAG: hypothetical protein IK130_10470 [Oscillospiraceae bacterium]|nr:hypothetical protein [Oscillospiraceae bacterium]
MKKMFAAAAAGLTMIPLLCSAASAEDTGMTFALTAEQNYFFESDLREAGKTVHGQFWIRNYQPCTAIRTILKSAEPLEIVNGQFTQPYFFHDCFFRAYTQYSPVFDMPNIIVWNGPADDDYNIEPMRVVTPEGSFAEFDINIPQNTPAGVYELSFRNGEYRESDGNTIPDTYAQNDMTELSVAFESCNIVIEPDSLRGDVDCNGVVDSLDAKYALEYEVAYNRTKLKKTNEALSETFHTPYIHTGEKAADADLNGKLDSRDALAILKYHTLKLAHLPQEWSQIFPDEK